MKPDPQTTKKPETVEEWKEKGSELIRLLIECRNALPAINMTSARLRGIDLRLDEKIAQALKPWEVKS